MQEYLSYVSLCTRVTRSLIYGIQPIPLFLPRCCTHLPRVFSLSTQIPHRHRSPTRSKPTVRTAPSPHNSNPNPSGDPKAWTGNAGYIDLQSPPVRPSKEDEDDMPQPLSPAYLFNTRILQIVLALVYLILLSYSGVHRGWWLNLSQPLGFGS